MSEQIHFPDDLITLAEAAAVLPRSTGGKKVHTTTLYRWIVSGKLEGWKVGGCWRVSLAAVLGMVRLARTTPELATRRQRQEQFEEAKRYLESRGYNTAGRKGGIG